jgi:hypothetical protein
MDIEWQDVPEYSLSENDTNVLHVLEEEDLTRFTFGGLKRRLGVHPESLSRALYRLEDQGIVEKGLGGYEVTPKAREFLRVHALDAEEPRVPLLRTLLPPDAPAHQVISSLQGRWFGMLRWLGYSENKRGVTLKWISEDGGVQVDANFLEDELIIEAKLLREKNLNVAVKASYQLIGHITKLYLRHERIRRIAYCGCFDPQSMAS